MSEPAQMQLFEASERAPLCTCGRRMAKNGHHHGRQGWLCNYCRPKLAVSCGGERIQLGRRPRVEHTRLRAEIDARTEQIKKEIRGT